MADPFSEANPIELGSEAFRSPPPEPVESIMESNMFSKNYVSSKVLKQNIAMMKDRI